jgi:hypothetical protein
VSVTDGVEIVLSTCVPPEIRETAVAGVAVVVATLHALGARSDEGEKDESVNLDRATPV